MAICRTILGRGRCGRGRKSRSPTTIFSYGLSHGVSRSVANRSPTTHRESSQAHL